MVARKALQSLGKFEAAEPWVPAFAGTARAVVANSSSRSGYLPGLAALSAASRGRGEAVAAWNVTQAEAARRLGLTQPHLNDNRDHQARAEFHVFRFRGSIPLMLLESVKHKNRIRERGDVLDPAAAVLRRIEGESGYRVFS